MIERSKCQAVVNLLPVQHDKGLGRPSVNQQGMFGSLVATTDLFCSRNGRLSNTFKQHESNEGPRTGAQIACKRELCVRFGRMGGNTRKGTMRFSLPYYHLQSSVPPDNVFAWSIPKGYSGSCPGGGKQHERHYCLIRLGACANFLSISCRRM